MIPVYRRWRYRRHRDDDRRLLVAMRGGGRNFGYPISRAAGLRAARTFRALTRLQQAGLLTTGWENKPVHPRRWYQLTQDGMVRAQMYADIDALARPKETT